MIKYDTRFSKINPAVATPTMIGAIMYLNLSLHIVLTILPPNMLNK